MNEIQESTQSIKFGLCKAMSEFGLSPDETEQILKHAGLFGSFSPMDSVISPAFTVALGGGALAGIGTAMLRSKVEHMGDKTEDESMRKDRMRIEMYKKMISDLKDDQSSMPA